METAYTPEQQAEDARGIARDAIGMGRDTLRELTTTRAALERLVECAEPFVPEERYVDEQGDNLEAAIRHAEEVLGG